MLRLEINLHLARFGLEKGRECVGFALLKQGEAPILDARIPEICARRVD